MTIVLDGHLCQIWRVKKQEVGKGQIMHIDARLQIGGGWGLDSWLSGGFKMRAIVRVDWWVLVSEFRWELLCYKLVWQHAQNLIQLKGTNLFRHNTRILENDISRSYLCKTRKAFFEEVGNILSTTSINPCYLIKVFSTDVTRLQHIPVADSASNRSQLPVYLCIIIGSTLRGRTLYRFVIGNLHGIHF